MERDYGVEALEIISQEDLARYLGVLMRVARIGEVSLHERDLAIPIARLLGASEEQTRRAIVLADDEKLGLDEFAAAIHHPVSRLCLFRDACRMACADGVVGMEESQILRCLAEALGMDDGLATDICEQVKVTWFTQAKFLDLLRELTDQA